ncbi:VCBS repeat-containing protein [candidate division KSB1 bacterium]|nr:VCBS repeat-containing protein [candidate division KSB1 bacterium]
MFKIFIASLAFLLVSFTIGSAQTTFTDVTSDAQITAAGTTGLGFFDFDNDNDFDIYLHFYAAPNILYRNEGAMENFVFTDATAAAGLNATRGGAGPSIADYNNDGFQDIFLSMHGPKIFYKNIGDGTFTDVNATVGITNSGITNGKAFGDYNNDGYLDLYLVNWNSDEPATLYKNSGPPDWKFTDVTLAAGAAFHGWGHACVFVDYDNDGDQDIFISVYYGNNVLFRNNGNGTFTDVSAQAGIQVGERCRGITWGDYDNDGDLDLYVTRGSFHTPYANYLFRNEGAPNWNFSDVSGAAGVAHNGDGSMSAFGDYDNDGDLDISIGNITNQRNVLYQNNGNGTFTDVAGSAGVAGSFTSCGMAPFGDYNNDGFPDIYATNDHAHVLFKNNGNSNNWIKIKLIGTVSNRDGLGARISLTTGARTQIREVDGGNLGMAFQCPQPVSFGLGTAMVIDQIRVRWPSGIISTLTQVVPNQCVTIIEKELSLEGAVKFYPHYLNTKIKFGMLIGFIELPRTEDVYQIKKGTVKITQIGENELTTPISALYFPWFIFDYNHDGLKDLMVGFNLNPVVTAIGKQTGPLEITLSGKVAEKDFMATDTIVVFDWPHPATLAKENFEFLEISATELPGEFNLTQNYPNPFNLTTTINYQMPIAGMAELTIYNSLGETVRTLMNQYQTAGCYSIKWDGCDQNNQSVVSGVYFYRLRVDNSFSVIRKMVVIK